MAVNYVHAALLLHSAGKEITETTLKKVVEATGSSADEAMLKSLVSSLEGVNIEEAIKSAAAAPVAAAAAPAAAKAEEKKEEDAEKKAEEAAAGLGALFG
ncbi:MAG: 50S ribosomal protein P1 [Candidatus Aenigmarchaeota archaeon]|nr:50S ribosomal protein P1 [Candidatus Aenigmarchaeota archaeon]